MRESAKISGARVVGLNNNDYQVKRCGYLAKKTGLDGVVSAVKVSFCLLLSLHLYREVLMIRIIHVG